MTGWWLADVWLMNSWWMADDWLMTTWWLADERLITGWWMLDECLMTGWCLVYDWLMTCWWMPDECLKALQRYFHLNLPTKMFAWNFQTFSRSSMASVRQKIMAPFLTLLSLLKTSFCPKSRKILLANKKFPQCSVENKFK